MSLLGIDIGSGSCKGVVFDVCGNILAQTNQTYAPCSPAINMVEMNPEIFWQSVVKVTRRLSEMVISDPIEALAISSHGETVIPVDKDGNHVYPAIMNSDNRADIQAKQLEECLGRDKIYEITGLPVHTMFSLNKIMWLKSNMREIYDSTDKFVSVADYILIKMGLPPYTDYSLASRTMAFDINSKKWSDDILKCAGVSESKMSIPIPSGKMAGKLLVEIAAALGLKEGVTVAMGGHDQPCGALGTGAIYDRCVSVSAGTYECLTLTTNEPLNTKAALKYSLNTYCHVIPGKYVTLAFYPAGLVSRWFVEEFCQFDALTAAQQNKDCYQYLDEKAFGLTEPTGICVTPHFVGSCNPFWDVRERGTITGLTTQVTRYHLYKAIYEGIACEFAQNSSILCELAGGFDDLRICGGNAKANFTVQMRADLSGKRISTLHTNEAVCKGAAILAGVCSGIYKNYDEAVKQTVKVNKIFEPDCKNSQEYCIQFQKYKLLYPALEKVRDIQ